MRCVSSYLARSGLQVSTWRSPTGYPWYGWPLQLVGITSPGIASSAQQSEGEEALIYQLDLFGSVVAVILIRNSNRISEKFAAKIERLFEFYPGWSYDSSLSLVDHPKNISYFCHYTWVLKFWASPGAVHLSCQILNVTPAVSWMGCSVLLHLTV
jgi:hypothetical protein